jgi:hypothetical protein
VACGIASASGRYDLWRDAADAVARVQALSLRVLADRLEHGEAVPESLNVTFRAAYRRMGTWGATKARRVLASAPGEELATDIDSCNVFAFWW